MMSMTQVLKAGPFLRHPLAHGPTNQRACTSAPSLNTGFCKLLKILTVKLESHVYIVLSLFASSKMTICNKGDFSVFARGLGTPWLGNDGAALFVCSRPTTAQSQRPQLCVVARFCSWYSCRSAKRMYVAVQPFLIETGTWREPANPT